MQNRIPEFPYLMLEYLDAARRGGQIMPLWLGGTSGSGGGVGSPPGGFLGQLTQTNVAYDTSELGTTSTSGSSSLLDNLNHIRYWMDFARLFEVHQTNPISARVYVGAGRWSHTANARPLIFTGTHSPLITSGSADHVDVLYLDTSGSVFISVSPNLTPIYPSGVSLPLYEMYIRVSSGSVYDVDQGVQAYLLRDVRPFLNLGTTSGSSGISGSGTAGQIAVWSSSNALISYATLAFNSGTGVLTLGAATLQLDGSMRFDPAGAASGHVLTYNGSKWVSAVPTSGSTNLTGTGVANRVPYFASAQVLTSGSNFSFNPATSALTIGSILRILGDMTFDPTSGSSGQVLTYVGGIWVPQTPNPGYLSKITANDTTGGYLSGKLVEGSGITLTVSSPGGNETLVISTSGSSGGGATDILQVQVFS